MIKSTLIADYIANMKSFLLKTTDLSSDEIEDKIKNVISQRYKPEIINVMETDKNHNVIRKKHDLLTFTELHCTDNVVSPSGSIYTPASVKESFVSKMIHKNIIDRSKFKKEMFKAKVNDDDVLYNIYYQLQTIKKIINNSFSGAYGSEYNFFYDKGNYNSITSIARSLIANAYTNNENLLGDNFGFYDEEMIINYIIQCLDNYNEEKVMNAMHKYKLKTVMQSELIDKYLRIVAYYKPSEKLSKVKKILDKLDGNQISYLFYYNSLKAIMFTNSQNFKKWIQACMNIDNITTNGIMPNDIFNIDEILSQLVTIIYGNILLPKDTQVYELPEKYPEQAKKFIAVARHFEKYLKTLDDLFETFIYSNMMIPDIDKKKSMARDVVPFSDTDSTTATLKDWVQWYTGDIIKTTKESFQISGLCIYWLTKITERLLEKFSIAHGAYGKYSKLMQMKNEFLYVSQILYDIKKNYAGIISIQEGIVLPEPDVDIKGAVLRSSNICQTSTAFIKEVIVDDILKKSVNNRIKAKDLIEKVVEFEYKIRDSLKNGSIEFLRYTSVDNKDNYKNPYSSVWFHLLAWNTIFAEKYGEIVPPLKGPQLQLLSPTVSYLDYLKRYNNKIHNGYISFKDKYTKYPPYVIINPMYGKIPKELIPIIDVRSIVFHNVKAIYLTLERFGICMNFEKKKLLLSDIY